MKKKLPRYNVSCRYAGYLLYRYLLITAVITTQYSRHPHAERPERVVAAAAVVDRSLVSRVLMHFTRA